MALPLHHEIADRTADVALAVAPSPARILDVGCGTGSPRLLASRCPDAAELAGVYPAPGMIKVAASAGSVPSISLRGLRRAMSG